MTKHTCICDYILLIGAIYTVYMYTLQHLCGQKRAGPEVQTLLNERIGHALQVMVLLCPLKRDGQVPCHPKYICILHISVHILVMVTRGRGGGYSLNPAGQPFRSGQGDPQLSTQGQQLHRMMRWGYLAGGWTGHPCEVILMIKTINYCQNFI